MLNRISLFIVLLFSVTILSQTHAAENIKVLIVNDIYSKIPSKNEKIDKLGSMKGDLLVMGTRYTGDIDIWKGNNGLYIVNELPIEEYVKDVVAAEVSPDWDMESLKAQAVVSRTYALYQKRMNGNSIYHIASSVIHQVYKGNNPDVRVSYAVSQTQGEVLTYNGKTIEAFYHSTCGGMTENPEDVFGKSYPYLKSLESSCELSPYSFWERSIEFEEIEKALNLQNIQEISIKSYTASKRVKQLEITYHSGKTIISANDLRKALGWNRLPSTNFHMTRNGDTLIFEGKGYGHGVGMCQWCALRMSREGKNYKEILTYFYPGTAIQIHEGF
jgi:stage II sporulation protein D